MVYLGIALGEALLQPVDLSAGVFVFGGFDIGDVVAVAELAAPPPFEQLDDALHPSDAAYQGQYVCRIHWVIYNPPPHAMSHTE